MSLLKCHSCCLIAYSHLFVAYYPKVSAGACSWSEASNYIRLILILFSFFISATTIVQYMGLNMCLKCVPQSPSGFFFCQRLKRKKVHFWTWGIHKKLGVKVHLMGSHSISIQFTLFLTCGPSKTKKKNTDGRRWSTKIGTRCKDVANFLTFRLKSSEKHKKNFDKLFYQTLSVCVYMYPCLCVWERDKEKEQVV